jgi:hypothetical protein
VFEIDERIGWPDTFSQFFASYYFPRALEQRRQYLHWLLLDLDSLASPVKFPSRKIRQKRTELQLSLTTACLRHYVLPDARHYTRLGLSQDSICLTARLTVLEIVEKTGSHGPDKYRYCLHLRSTFRSPSVHLGFTRRALFQSRGSGKVARVEGKTPLAGHLGASTKCS